MKSNIITAAVVIGVVAIIAIMYQSLVVIPQNEIEAKERQVEAELRQERLREIVRKQEYDQCISSAYKVYSDSWDAKCVIEGKEPDCTLFAYQYNVIEQRHEEAENTCLSLYKAAN